MDQVDALKQYVRMKPGKMELYGLPFQFHDSMCFLDSYQEIFQEQIYKFNSSNPHPYIIDCGANMGVSVLYLARLFPSAKILAFEPEEGIFSILKANVEQFGLNQVTLIPKAVWDSETTLQFTSDHGMGGSVENVFSTEKAVTIETVRLADYLNQPVDFLKLDIEGAEYTVLKDCAHLLHNVQHLFVECHSFINKKQQLHEVLQLLQDSGYRYHLKQSFSQHSPFTDRVLACENMDMAINVFAYRH